MKNTATSHIVHLDEHYVDPRLAELYDIECGWSEDRDFYLDLAGQDPKAVLDLGCGTGVCATRMRPSVIVQQVWTHPP